MKRGRRTERSAESGRETLGIVVRRFEWSETSRLVHLVTPDLGKVRLLARGVHRATSPWRGLFDHWNLLRISLRFRPELDLQNLQNAELVEHFPGLRRSLDAYLAANYATELVAATAQAGEAQPERFADFRTLLGELAGPPLRPRSLLLAFELRLLDSLGLRPALTACARCGKTLSEGTGGRTWALFQVAAGGLGCSECRNDQPWDTKTRATAWRRIRIDHLRAGERLLEGALREASRAVLEAGCERTLRRLVDEFLTHHLEHRPRARTHLRW